MLESIQFDLNPILLDTMGDTNGLPRPFRFIAAWFRDNSCKFNIQVAWENEAHGSSSFNVVQKIKRVKQRLHGTRQSLVSAMLRELHGALAVMRAAPPTKGGK